MGKELITLNRFDGLVDVQNADLTYQIGGEFGNLSPAEKGKACAQSRKGGLFFIFESVNEPGHLLEMVMGLDGSGDSMLTLYRPHPLFNSPGTLLQARESLVAMLADFKGASVTDQPVFADHGRGRVVLPMEMSTMQLVRLVQREIDPYVAAGAIAL